MKGRWTRLTEFRNVGIATVIAWIALSFSKDRIAGAFRMEYFPVAQLSILLLFVTLVLIYLWIKAAINELQMLQDFFPEFVPAIPKPTFTITVSIATLLGVLSYFSYRIIIYSSIFVCIKLFEFWGIWIRDFEIRDGLKRARDETSVKKDELQNGWDILEEYYFQRQQVPLAVTILSFSFISVILGLLGELLPQSATWLLSFAYGIMLLSIAFNEAVYAKWRQKRDDALGESYS